VVFDEVLEKPDQLLLLAWRQWGKQGLLGLVGHRVEAAQVALAGGGDLDDVAASVTLVLGSDDHLALGHPAGPEALSTAGRAPRPAPRHRHRADRAPAQLLSAHDEAMTASTRHRVDHATAQIGPRLVHFAPRQPWPGAGEHVADVLRLGCIPAQDVRETQQVLVVKLYQLLETTSPATGPSSSQSHAGPRTPPPATRSRPCRETCHGSETRVPSLAAIQRRLVVGAIEPRAARLVTEPHSVHPRRALRSSAARIPRRGRVDCEVKALAARDPDHRASTSRRRSEWPGLSGIRGLQCRCSSGLIHLDNDLSVGDARSGRRRNASE